MSKRTEPADYHQKWREARRSRPLASTPPPSHPLRRPSPHREGETRVRERPHRPPVAAARGLGAHDYLSGDEGRGPPATFDTSFHANAAPLQQRRRRRRRRRRAAAANPVAPVRSRLADPRPPLAAGSNPAVGRRRARCPPPRPRRPRSRGGVFRSLFPHFPLTFLLTFCSLFFADLFVQELLLQSGMYTINPPLLVIPRPFLTDCLWLQATSTSSS